MWPFDATYPVQRLEDVLDHTYDYIVIGGGTAGSAVASRLSEIPNATVLVLEKGSVQDGIQSRIPLISTANGSYAVHRNSAPEPQIGGRKVEVLSAETLGGSSRMNAMIYTRGAPAYYNRWAEIYPDWSWENVEPYFNKVEETIYLRQTSELESNIYPFLELSADALGLPLVASPNQPGAPAMGYFSLDLTIDPKGYRHSALRAYLPKEIATQRQSSLHICTDVFVCRLDLDAACSRVRGVFVQSSDAEQRDSKLKPKPSFIRADREVILAAGAICTPQILQLSGLGPRSLLESLGISVVQDLPGVGSHLGDHILFPVHVQVPAEDCLQQLLDSPLLQIKHAILYAIAGKGWFKSAIDRAMFFSTAQLEEETGKLRATDSTLNAHKSKNLPDVELIVVPVGSSPDEYPGKALFTLQACMTQPQSTGTVEIMSMDPNESPRIQLGMLHTQQDRQVALKALRFTLRLAEHFVHNSGYPNKACVFGGPGSDRGAQWKEGDWRLVSDEDLNEYVSKYTTSAFHLTSSCRMASKDEGGVVGNDLRVYGFRNLRIADASILPSILPAHPMAATYMIAERCADFVKKSWC